MPEIVHSFFFNVHRTEKTLTIWRVAIESADIVVPEGIAWTPKDQELFNKVSCGEIDPRDAFEHSPKIADGSSFWKVLSVLHKSEKAVLLADIPEGDELLDIARIADVRAHNATGFFRNGDFDAAIRESKRCMEKFAEVHIKREDKIKNSIKEKVKGLFAQNSEWMDKDKINVFISMSAAHASMRHDFKDELLDARSAFSYPLMVSSVDAEIFAMVRRGMQVSDELNAKAIVEPHVLNHLCGIQNDGGKCSGVSRKVLSQLSFEDIKELSERVGLYGSVLAEIKNLGIYIPNSEDEMNAMLPKSKLYPHGTKNAK